MPSFRPSSVMLSAVMLSAVMLPAAAIATTVAAKMRPHIVMILADDCEAQPRTAHILFVKCTTF
eukprot:COSAG02_NODE_6117_length_3788_cov_77.670371_4_plen_64_part_00